MGFAGSPASHAKTVSLLGFSIPYALLTGWRCLCQDEDGLGRVASNHYKPFSTRSKSTISA
jgi:hypothetical protein